MHDTNIVAQGINDAWLKVIEKLNSQGVECAPRGKKNKELENMSIKILNPKKRILTLPIRKISLPFAFGELLWYLSGRNDVKMMKYYSKMMTNFSDDGETLNSAYGYRIFGNHPMLPFDQWEFAVNKLKEDKDSRQAIIHLHTPNNKKNSDEVCTLTLQFLIRDNKLDMVVNMRSNDIVWGFTYDVFSFTTFQELIANELGIDVGDYYHNAASMHIYEKDYKYLSYVEGLGEDLLYSTKYDTEFDYGGITIFDPQLRALFDVESFYRCNIDKDVVTPVDNKALGIMRNVFNLYNTYKFKKNGKSEVIDMLEYDNIYHSVMRNYISGKSLDDSGMMIIEGCDGAGKTTFINDILEFSPISHSISFSKPSDDFDKQIYFHTAMMTGEIVLDRFFYSEIVYSELFNRECKITRKDSHALENMLRYRGANLLYMDTDPLGCYGRLNKEDKGIFTLQDINRICSLYDDVFNESLLSPFNRRMRMSDAIDVKEE